MRKFLISAVFSAISLCAVAQDTYITNQTEPLASYEIEAKLDTDAKMISGSEILTWKNNTLDTVSELMFHTYLNAFKNSRSTFFIESQLNTGYNLGEYMAEDEMGYIDVLRMVIVDGDPLTQDLVYFQPDDNNDQDQTVMKVKLPNSVLPGQQIKLSITFLAKLPKIISRTGYERGDFYMVGQWYPKIGVYEPKGMRQRPAGGWNCHQFHYNSEFYSDFGNYDVSINVPENFKVAATGVETCEATIGDGTKTYQFSANNVIDFAWAASPRFRLFTDTFKKGESGVKGIKLYYMPEHSDEAHRYVEAVKNAMEYMTENVGDFPYPQISLVDCPYYAEAAAGMEYPMFVTVNTFRNMPMGIREGESVAIHEFVHNYFQSVVATNEFEEAWLDEGFTSFYEAEILDKYYGDGSLYNFMGFKINASEIYRTQYTQSYNPSISAIDNFSWKYPSYTYETMAYFKTCTMMQTLKGILGNDLFRTVMQSYFDKYKFAHPSGRDFIALVNQQVAKQNDAKLGPNLNWFFDAMLRTDQVCDYKLAKIVNRTLSNKSHGFFDNGISKLFVNSDTSEVSRTSIYVQRMGTMVMPVELLVTFQDGTTQTLYWDGRARCKEFVVNSQVPVLSAQIDPDRKISCDIDMVNNSMSVESTSNPIWKYAAKFLFWIENIFQSVAFFA